MTPTNSCKTYYCPRCGSNEFAIDEYEEIDYTSEYKIKAVQTRYEVGCRNCGGYVGDLDINVKMKGV